jgi:hypothetical protein
MQKPGRTYEFNINSGYIRIVESEIHGIEFTIGDNTNTITFKPRGIWSGKKDAPRNLPEALREAADILDFLKEDTKIKEKLYIDTFSVLEHIRLKEVGGYPNTQQTQQIGIGWKSTKKIADELGITPTSTLTHLKYYRSRGLILQREMPGENEYEWALEEFKCW